jgi:hypothetical protein
MHGNVIANYVTQADALNMILLPLTGTLREDTNETITQSLRNNVVLLLYENPVFSIKECQLTVSISVKNVS